MQDLDTLHIRESPFVVSITDAQDQLLAIFKPNLLEIFANLPPEKQNSAFRDNCYTLLFDIGILLLDVCLGGSVLLQPCIEYEHTLCWCDHIR